MSDFDIIVMRKKRIDLSVARDLKEQTIVFTHCRVEASSGDALANLHFNATDNEAVKVIDGRRFKNWNVSKIYIDNDAQAGAWIDLFFWGGPVMGPPEIEDDHASVDIGGSVAIGANDGLVSTADKEAATAAKTSLIASNTSRKSILIRNLDSSNELRIGDTNVTATRGHQLKAGDSIVLDTTAEIFAYNAAGAGVDVSLLEVE